MPSVQNFRKAIELQLGRTHVGKSDEYVEDMIRKAAIRSNDEFGYGLTKRQVDALVKMALKIHHKNQDLYQYVMGGMKRRHRAR